MDGSQFVDSGGYSSITAVASNAGICAIRSRGSEFIQVRVHVVDVEECWRSESLAKSQSR